MIEASGQETGAIARLNAKVASVLAPYLPGGAFALLDFPDHANVGDSSIWLGTLAHFRRSGLSPAYVCTCSSFDPDALAAAAPDGPLFIQGGGNFGDLWPVHQDFRCEILRRYPGRPIIQLPQSIHFNDAAAIAETRRAIAAHGAFTLLVRDHASAGFAAAHFDCPIILCPDMAFCLGPLTRPVAPSHETLYLLRADRERLSSPSPPAGALVTDWPSEPAPYGEALNRFINVEIAAGRIKTVTGVTKCLAAIRHARGVRTLSLGRHVVTDRLHGHILATLLGISHTVRDNNYGKLSRFIETWATGDVGGGV